MQNYFEQVGKLLIEKPLLDDSPGDKLSTVVRAQTLTVLYESRLIDRDKPVVSLKAANLRGANLSNALLDRSDLTEADLSGANLRRANLHHAKGVNAKKIEEQQPFSLSRAIMPDGSKRPKWSTPGRW